MNVVLIKNEFLVLLQCRHIEHIITELQGNYLIPFVSAGSSFRRKPQLYHYSGLASQRQPFCDGRAVGHCERRHCKMQLSTFCQTGL